MAVSNTAPLVRFDIDNMNDGLRPFTLNQTDAEQIADYFGVSVRTAQRWFADDDQQYRRCVPLSFVDGEGERFTTVGQRIFCMFDQNDPDNGFGDGNAEGGTRIWQSLRLRCLLGACLGTDGGLIRTLPVYNGDIRFLGKRHNYLDEALFWLNTVYTGNAEHGDFLERAWVAMTITPIFGDGGQNGWESEVMYRKPLDGESDDEPTSEPDE